MKDKLLQPVSKRQAAVVIAILLGVVLLGWGGWTLYAKYSGRPQSVAQVKRAIWKHLGKQARTKKFQPPLDSSSVALLDVVTTTNKSGRVRTTSRATRSSSLDLPETTVSEYFRTNQALAAGYEPMYQAIGEQLKVSDDLLKSTEAPRRLTGLVLAGEASIYARTNALDLWLSARICEGYLWPNLALVEGTNRTFITLDSVLNLCDLSFRDAGETNNMIRTYESFIAKGGRAQSVDAARFRLALIHMDQNENAKALKLLKAIKTIKTAKIDREIARLELIVPADKK